MSEIGFSSQDVVDVLEGRGIETEDRELVVSLDINGPLASTESSMLEPQNGIAGSLEALNPADDTVVVLNSGYDLVTQEWFKQERLGGQQLPSVGELGSAYMVDGEIEFPVKENGGETVVDVYQGLFDYAADYGRKINPQMNQGPFVGSLRVEGEGTTEDPRGELFRRPDIAAQEIATEDIYRPLMQDEEFHYDSREGVIYFENTRENAETLWKVLTGDRSLDPDFRFPGVRFVQNGDYIGFYRDDADADIGMNEARDFVEAALLEGWEYHHNDDWGTDFVREDVEVGKEEGVSAFAQEYFGPGSNPLILHVGDSRSDLGNYQERWVSGETPGNYDFVVFPQEETGGTETDAYRTFQDSGFVEGEDYLAVKDGSEFVEYVAGSFPDRLGG